jgi:hypothetical protein
MRPTSGQEGARRAASTVLAYRRQERWKGSSGDVRKRSVGVRAWARTLGLEKTVVEGVDDGEDGAIVVSVRPRYSQRDRCPHCRRRCPGYDLGEGRRRWRALDLGTTKCFLEADAPRVECRQHGVVVAAVPWARHDAGFTRSFDDQAAWLAVNTSKSAITALMRIAWRTVGRICERVAVEAKAGRDLYANLTKLGFDEISIRKGSQRSGGWRDRTYAWPPRGDPSDRTGRAGASRTGATAIRQGRFGCASFLRRHPRILHRRVRSGGTCASGFSANSRCGHVKVGIRARLWRHADRDRLVGAGDRTVPFDRAQPRGIVVI